MVQPNLQKKLMPSQTMEASGDSKPPQPRAINRIRDKLKTKKGKLADRKEQLKEMSKPPGGFDATPLPDAPQGYTLKFTFHRVYDLPAGDLHSSSDPFIHATLTAPVPRRHKEDPPLTRRTRTVRRTTEPVWNEDWIVANVPASGFTLKCRLYDEDWPDRDDRLGTVTVRVPHVDENWEGLGPEEHVFEVRKRTGSKRAYLIRGASVATCGNGSVTPRLHISIRVLGKSDPPHAQMYTVGPTTWVKHFSPMIGRLAGVKVNRDEERDAVAGGEQENDRGTKKYDFQANEIQLSGPVPPKLYHRYVEFRPMIGRMFSSRGLRGRVLHKVLQKQHKRIYNYDSSTEYGSFAPCSEEATLQFLRMVHFDEGGRIFTYLITLDGMMRFTETGKEFGIDLLSKHTMHSDVATYVACAGEFFIRRLAHPVSHAGKADAPFRSHQGSSTERASLRASLSASSCRSGQNNNENTSPDDDQPTHPPESPSKGPLAGPPPQKPNRYRLTIDNDSGTYRPDASVLPDLQAFLSRNFPGLDVVAMRCGDDRLSAMKAAQTEAKKRSTGAGVVRMVPNRNPSSSSFSSGDESRLGTLDRLSPAPGTGGDVPGEDAGGGEGRAAPLRSKKERAFDLASEPGRWREVLGLTGPEGIWKRRMKRIKNSGGGRGGQKQDGRG
ncbi:hypothetical protein MYCTH_2308965 [Thermothelomyces thermophilus ATCC 42464]|uniref:C2 domain-containing protein n=1 Tax=Thermothelomyces thermophilus (strain ATCC 42464 / BCRC 31852 / DSM 1799) TaxID=573729 RepID=G2QKJ8_THET4|nr:uncharacterized protein MYCTH_2308965 [Thermothelomyces thermophilus ATCC 42464]AEO60104.1 hypothetical protein MYCTH_2308965 [Thermothelomyces thermophilus ATCC 42464]